jgi:hypothetical protein
MNKKEKLRIKKFIKDDICCFSFRGFIDEDFRFDYAPKLLAEDFPAYLFEFYEVQLNSCGIRDWIEYISQLSPARLIYVNCPVQFINQINTVSGFITSNTEIQSFFVPYYCEQCDHERHVCVKTNDLFKFHLPRPTCFSCQKTLELDVNEDNYLRFLKPAA